MYCVAPIKVKAPWLGLMRLPLVCALLIAIFAYTALASAEEKAETGRVTAKLQTGYARLIFSFTKRPEHNITSTSLQNGVLVLRFDRAVDINTGAIVQNLPTYVSSVRSDKDGKSLRFALERQIRVNTAEVNNELYVDLLPEPWLGAVPPLPQHVVDELMRQAQEEERLRKEQEEHNKRAVFLGEVKVTSAEAPTFTRVEFLWPDKVPTALQRKDDQLQVIFDRLGDVKLATIQAHPPRFIEGAEAKQEDGRTIVTMKVDAMRDVRMFEEGNAIYVDVQGPQRGALEMSSLGDAAQSQLPALTTQGPELALYGKTPEEKAITAAPASTADNFIMSAPATAEIQEKAEAKQIEIRTTLEPEKISSQAAAQEAADNKSYELVPDASIVENVGLRVTFPFSTETGASFFQRGQTLWLVFATDQKIDIKPIADLFQRKLKRIDVNYQDKLAVLRFELDAQFLISASSVDTSWFVTFGEQIFDRVEPAELKTHISPDGRYIVNAYMNRAVRIAKLHDPVVGDNIITALAVGPPIGMVKPQQFIDFTALATLHGAALIPHSDNLDVRLDDIGFVIEKAGSMAVSFAKIARAAELSSQQMQSTYGFVDFEGWKLGPQDQFSEIKDTLITRASVENLSERNAARLDLARFYIAYELGAEALSVLKLVAQQDPAAERELSFRIIRGVANIQAGHYAAAERDLSDPLLDENPDIALWRGLAAAYKNDWRMAYRYLERAQSVATNYPRSFQGRMQILQAKATIKLQDLVNTDSLLDEAAHLVSDEKSRMEITLLRGRFNEAVGRYDTAISFYKQIDPDLYPQIGTDAMLRMTALQERLGQISQDEAEKRLDHLSFAWRGDDIELEIYRQLGTYYAKSDKFRPAFTAMRNASLARPDAEISRQLFDDMRIVFTSLFLDGKADKLPAQEALSLFYDFRELTPAGRLGDDIIRRLADRLVQVDLLDQAISLLDHQVNRRLSGLQRTEVATELALIHLMNREPQKSLSALHRTRQTTMPEFLEKKRTLIEARALAQTGRPELATELLTGDSEDVTRLRADILWEAKRWDQCGETLEKLLANVKDDKTLTSQQQADVMRGAVCYALAEDAEGVQRFRKNFSHAMSATAEAHLFDVATSPIEQQGSEFRALARNLSGVDNLQSFWESYRNFKDDSKKAESITDVEPQLREKDPA